MSPAKTGASSALAELSTQLAGAVETAGKSVVAIHARRRIPSSGILWRDGVIVSAGHTVKSDGDVQITMPDGESATATIAGRDSATDLIALRVKGVRAQPAAMAGEDSLRVGSLVLAVGRPGRSVTASFGIISAVTEGWRTWQGTRVERALRLDLAIYDGFSGGPLVNASGAIVGVDNSALARGTPVAIPAPVVDRVLDEILEHGHVRRPFIGVAVQPVALSAALTRQHQLAGTALLVTSVAEGSPADKAGIFVGDVLIKANGAALDRPTDLLDALAAVTAGESVNLALLRGASLKSLSVTPANRGAAE